MQSKILGLHLLTGLIYNILLSTGYNCDLNEKKLLKYLFDPKRENAHDILERPSQNVSQPVEVRVKPSLIQLIDLNEKKETFHTNMWLYMTWKDYHFQWDPQLFGGITEINLPAEKVWKPDLLLFNCANEKVEGFFPVNVQIKYTSVMKWIPPITPISTCSMDITWFPFDTQNCTLKYGSWTYKAKYLDLKLQCEKKNSNQSIESCSNDGMINLINYTPNGEYNIVDCPTKRLLNTYDGKTFSDVYFTIRLQRKYMYYIFNLLAPCIIISALSSLVFIIPPDAGEKISLGITVLLSMTMFLFLVADKLPQTSKTIPMISIYFTCIMLMCSLSMLFTVIVINFHYESFNSKPIPSIMKKIVNVWLAKLLFMRQNEKANIRKRTLKSPSQSDNQLNEKEYSEVKEKCDEEKGIVDLSTVEKENELLGEENRYSKHDLSRLLREVKKLTQKMTDDENQQNIGNDWKFTARVIDRFCLIFSMIFIITSTLIVISKIPIYEKPLA